MVACQEIGETRIATGAGGLMNDEEEPLDGEEEELGEEQQFDDSLRPVASSMVSAWAYDREAGTIEVFFNSGGQESFSCSPDVWEEAKQAVSPGRFVHQNFL